MNRIHKINKIAWDLYVKGYDSRDDKYYHQHQVFLNLYNRLKRKFKKPIKSQAKFIKRKKDNQLENLPF